MPNTPPTTTPITPNELFRSLLGDQQAIVLVVNQDNQLVSYRVESLADVVAELSVSGFGQPLHP